MQAATILPQPYLDLIEKETYHLALAHLIGKAGFERYTDFYKQVGKDPEKFLIMDNGLIEGDPRPMDELMDKAYLINATEIVLPDAFQNKDETLREAHDAMNLKYSITAAFRLMAVPQGRTYEEWLECAKEMLTWPIDTIAIPKIVTKMAGRDGRLQALIDIQDMLADRDVHLLGCWESPLELKVIENYTRQGKIKPVRGVDSAIAYVYARAGLRMAEAERPAGAIDFNADDADVIKLMYNIVQWKHECATLPPLEEVDNIPRFW